MKQCTKCKITKPISEFPKDGSHKSGHECRCKVCKAMYMSEYFKRPEVKELRELKYKTDIRYIQKRRERQRKYALEKRYKHRSKRNAERTNMLAKKRRNEDPKVKLHDAMKARIRFDLKRGKAGFTTDEILKTILHYDIDQLKKHIEKQFKTGMTWDNYGIKGWHIDHKIPVAVFNFKSPNDIDFKKCWSLKNLQPLWAKDNCSKGSRISKPFQPSLLLKLCG